MRTTRLAAGSVVALSLAILTLCLMTGCVPYTRVAPSPAAVIDRPDSGSVIEGLVEKSTAIGIDANSIRRDIAVAPHPRGGQIDARADAIGRLAETLRTDECRRLQEFQARINSIVAEEKRAGEMLAAERTAHEKQLAAVRDASTARQRSALAWLGVICIGGGVFIGIALTAVCLYLPLLRPLAWYAAGLGAALALCGVVIPALVGLVNTVAEIAEIALWVAVIGVLAAALAIAAVLIYRWARSSLTLVAGGEDFKLALAGLPTCPPGGDAVDRAAVFKAFGNSHSAAQGEGPVGTLVDRAQGLLAKQPATQSQVQQIVAASLNTAATAPAAGSP